MASIKQTLLDRAKGTKTAKGVKNYTEEHKELLLAYFNGEVRMSQVSSALGRKGGSAADILLDVVRVLYMRKEIEIK